MICPKHLRLLLPAFLLTFAACSGDSSSSSPGAASAPQASDSAPNQEAGATKIDVNAVRDTARMAMFVPAPSEFQAALKATGFTIDLKAGVVDGPRDLAGKNKAIVALETGVRLANVLLTADSAEKSVLLERMQSARAGLAALKASPEVLAETDKLIADVTAGTISGAEATPALDVLAGRIQDQLSGSADKTTATLVQAGGWVQGAYLLSTALAQAKQAGDAAALLHQPTVVAHFSAFLRQAGEGDVAVQSVLAPMDDLGELAGKAELTVQDMTRASELTAAILKAF
jgi:hypothetical protein